MPQKYSQHHSIATPPLSDNKSDLEITQLRSSSSAGRALEVLRAPDKKTLRMVTTPSSWSAWGRYANSVIRSAVEEGVTKFFLHRLR